MGLRLLAVADAVDLRVHPSRDESLAETGDRLDD